jgi:hypothetical protein
VKIKKLFYRSCALVSEIKDTLHHLRKLHGTWSTPPRDRVLDIYALEDRVLFSIAPVANAAAVVGAGVVQDAQLSAMPAPDPALVNVQQVHAGQDVAEVFQILDKHGQQSALGATTAESPQAHEQRCLPDADSLQNGRHVDFALIDDSLQNIDSLLKSLKPDTEAVVYNNQQISPADLLNSISDWARKNNSTIDTMSILSHGTSGSFDLGNQWVSLSTLADSAEAWEQLGSVMTPGGDINIFGCDLASGGSGRELIDNIGLLSGANVFASVDDTGFGGNWTLEAASDTADPSAWHNPLDTQVLEHWNYQLAPGITVTPTSGLTTTESGGTAQFTLALNSAPLADVTVNISSSDTTEGTVSASSLTFTTANWSTAQTVTVTGVNDYAIDGNIAYAIITAPASSEDPIYNNMNAADVSVINLDNDPGMTITPATGLTTTEAGATAQFTAVLNSQPTSDVTVTFTSSNTTEGTVYTNNVDGTFTSLGWYVWNWQQGQGGWYYGHALNGDLSNYQQLSLSGGSWQNANGVNLQGWNYVPGNNNDSAVIRYVSQDTGQFRFSGAFGKQGWSGWGTGATVRFFANGQQVASEAIDGGDTSSHSFSVDVNLKAGDTFDLCIDAGVDNNGDNIWINEDVQKHTNSITFTSANWNTPQTISVIGVDDWIDDGNVAYSVAGAAISSDPNYNGIISPQASLINIDDDVAGVQIIQTGGSTQVTEGGAQDSYSIRLATQPTADVIVTLNPDNQLTVSATTLSFTTANWSTPQSVTVMAVDDSELEGLHTGTITHTITSGDQIYNSISVPAVAAILSDNEGITVSPISGLTTTEAGGTAQFSVALTNQPTGNVTFGISSSDTTEGTVSVSSLTFTPANWDQVQTVTVTGVNDWIIDGDVAYTIITGSVTSPDGRYNNSNPMDVSVTNTDDDVAGVTVTAGDGLTSESGRTAQITAVLASQPYSDVIVYFNSLDTSEGVTITSGGDIIANYDLEYSSTQSQDGWFYGYYVNSSDLTFHQLTWNVNEAKWTNPNGVNLWNWGGAGTPGGSGPFAVERYVAEETGSFNINGSFSRLDWYDGGDGMTGHLYLNGAEIWSGTVPGSGDHPIPFSEDVGLKAGDVIDFAVDPRENSGWDWFYFPNPIKVERITDKMIFTPTNWNIPQAISVTGVNDGIVDGNVEYNVSVSVDSSDSHYDNFTVSDVTLTNLETDLPGVQIRQSSGVTNVAEGGTTDSYTVRLTSLPTANVIVWLNTDSQLGFSANSLTFTSANWDSPQTVTVSAFDDNMANGSRTGTITHSVTSNDGSYDDISVTDVTVYITDKTPAGITITPIGGLTTTEDGGTAQFSIVLDSLPTVDVTINFSIDEQTEGNPFILGDIIADYSSEKSNIQGQNSWYYGYSPYGDTSTFNPMILMNSETWTDQGAPTPANFWTWGSCGATGDTNMAVLRYVAEESGAFRVGGSVSRMDWFGAGPHGDGMTVRLSLNGQQIWTGSLGAIYDPIGVPISLDVTMNEGDHLDFAVDKNEAAGFDAFTLPVYVQRLDNHVTFTRSDWNIPQIMTVKGLDDTAADGNVPYKIIGSVSSSDTHFSSLSAPQINLANVDNDPPTLVTPPTQNIVSSVTFSSENGNAIRVQNVDTRANPLHVQLNATNGQLTLGSTEGLTFVIGNGEANTTIEFLGSAAAVNNALNGMHFNPTASTGNLQIVVNNQGATLVDDSLVAVGYIGIEVTGPVFGPGSGANPSPGDNVPTSPPISTSPQTPFASPYTSSIMNSNQFSTAFRQSDNVSSNNEQNMKFNGMSTIMPNTILNNNNNSLNDYQNDLAARESRITFITSVIMPKTSDQFASQIIFDVQSMWKELKTFVDSGDKVSWMSKVSMGTVIGVGAGLSAGYMMMVFRYGALLTSSLVTFPVWQWVDPLPILESRGFKSGKQNLKSDDLDPASQLEDSLETIVS